jgi:alpha 1,2-mannosyltransferase
LGHLLGNSLTEAATMTRTRYLLAIFAIVISGHYILSLTHESYGRATSFSCFTQPSSPSSHNVPPESDIPDGHKIPGGHNSSLELVQRKANATFVILARNSDLDNTVRSIREMEDRFNTRHHYPYVLLNDEEFTEEFKRCVPVCPTLFFFWWINMGTM